VATENVAGVDDARPEEHGSGIAQMTFGFSLAMAGNGLLLAILGVRATRAGFSDAVTGAILGAYYVGFLVGARLVRGIVGRLGLARSLVALVAAMALIAAAPALGEVPSWWIVLRVMQGFGMSACYVVVETWLNAATGNDRRGHRLGVYMVCSMAAFALGSFVFRFTGADGTAPFLVASAMVGAGAIALAGLHAKVPAVHATKPEPVSLRLLFRLAPVGVAVGVLVGFVNGAFTSVAVYAERAGFTDAQTALISALAGIGPIVVLYPLSLLSDRVSRRRVLAGGAAAAAALLALAASMRPAGWPMMGVLTIAGGLTISLYTLTSAETNDHVSPNQMAGASGQVVLLYGIGAILGPVAVTATMGRYGPAGYFWLNAVGHIAAVAVVGSMTLARRSDRFGLRTSVS
jgi:MFS family permease